MPDQKNNGLFRPTNAPVFPNGEPPATPLSGALASALGKKPTLGQTPPELQERPGRKSGSPNAAGFHGRANFAARRSHVPGKGHK